MCGIVGFAGREPIDEGRLRLMNDTLAHRGPDDVGLWLSADRAAGLAHRRLAILDLSPGGHQPMAGAGGAVHIAFNGEIYNFADLRRELEGRHGAFTTSSDTEVVLAAYDAWGEAFLDRLDGMFSIALYDERRRQLYLARDRAGEKPLFYWRTAKRIVWTSELKAIFAFPDFPRRLNRQALEHYLAYGYVSGALCMLDGVAKLPPAHVLRYDVDSGRMQIRRYWDLPALGGPGGNAEALVGELEQRLLDAVRRQLVADVPVGILLSGGVDSSLVTAMAARVSSSPVRTFTVSFPGHAAQDEGPYARLVASHFGTLHTDLPADDASVSLLPRLARQYDEPMADSSMIPTYLVSRAIRQHATVALGGDGGDELFGGYPHYTWVQRLDRVRRLVPAPLRSAVSRGARHLPSGVRGRNYLVAAGYDANGGLPNINLYFDRAARRRLLVEPCADGAPEASRLALATGAHSMLQAAQRIDFRSYLVDDILVKVDRASMLASLETRAPFLDRHVIEFAFGSVPDALKVTLRGRKLLLRRLAAKLLPKTLDLERKQGFSIPLGAWFRGPEWGPFMRDVLHGIDATLFRAEAVRGVIAAEERYGNNTQRLFALMMFELWRREYGVAA